MNYKENKGMNSKEALQKMSNYIERLGGGETLEEEQIILDDLEVLDFLKEVIKEAVKEWLQDEK